MTEILSLWVFSCNMHVPVVNQRACKILPPAFEPIQQKPRLSFYFQK